MDGTNRRDAPAPDRATDDGPGADISVASFTVGGTPLSHVEVAISYGIIERFSEGLYSSPNKTFEELVTNSYDAGAKHVWVYLPEDLHNSGSSIVVVDDGESMDLAGLQNLWRIGESKKRDPEEAPPGRVRPVGKFGIGKLATYVLAHELTYITHRDNTYLAVTMDYGRISTESEELLHQIGLKLQVSQLTREEALASLRNALSGMPGDHKVVGKLFADESPSHWTAAILTKLKRTAGNIQQGRLKWVLRTALPLNPEFLLYYNDDPLLSSKATGQESWKFTIGEDENDLPPGDEKPWRTGQRTVAVDEEGHEVPAYKLNTAGIVWGTAVLFKNPLERGKSEDRARSHGYFVRVRGRLINLDSPDFEVGAELRHGTLTRFHMEVNADDLDEQVASARESLKDSPELFELKSYLLAVFNKARTYIENSDTEDPMPFLAKNGRISDPPPALSQGPLRRMLRKAADGDTPAQLALGLELEDINDVEQLLTAGGDLVSSVLVDDLGDRTRLVAYSPQRQAAVVNQSHPFVSNYLDGKQSNEAIRLLGLTELLTEAYMLDENIPSDAIERVMRRRDQFLRAVAHRNPRSAHVIATYLREASNDENHLEDAVGDALELLGFQVRRLGGAQHGPDGIATARLGRRATLQSDSYAFTYDAKSSGQGAYDVLADEVIVPPAKKIRADTARTSILRVHRERAKDQFSLDVQPTFTLLVAPGFQGESDDEAQINSVCRNDDIVAISVGNLARVVELFPIQGLNPYDLKELLDCRTPSETADWVDRQSKSARVARPPVANLVNILVKYSETRSATTVSHLAAYLQAEGIDVSDAEVDALVKGLQALAPKSIFTDGRVIALNAAPTALMRELYETLDQYDQDIVDKYRASMREELEEEE